MMKYHRVLVLLLLVSTLYVGGTKAMAGPGDILVSPVRVVFEGRERSMELTVANRSGVSATYRIEVVNRRMLEDGSFEKVEVALEGEQSSEKLFRYAPRRITLDPGSPQVIRVLLRKPSGLTDGEYRSHLKFSAVPDASSGNSISENEEGDSISIQLTPVYGVTIPIIVRHGDLNANVKVLSTKIVSIGDTKSKAIEVTLERTGLRSVYGTVSINVEGDSTWDNIREVRGVAVYAPNRIRRINIPLEPEALKKITGGNITVSFEENNVVGQPAMASSIFVLSD